MTIHRNLVSSLGVGVLTFFALTTCLSASHCGASGVQVVHTALEILDNVCQIVDVAKVDPKATEICVDERQISDVLQVLLGKQAGLSPAPAALPAGSVTAAASASPASAPACVAMGASAPRPVRLRLPDGKTVADLQKPRLARGAGDQVERPEEAPDEDGTAEDYRAGVGGGRRLSCRGRGRGRRLWRWLV